MNLKTNDRMFSFGVPSAEIYRLTNALRDFEYLYNILSIASMTDSGKSPVVWIKYTNIISGRKQLGVDITNLRLREMLVELTYSPWNYQAQQSYELRYSSVHSGSPVKVVFSGLEKALKTLIALFDPIQREDQREDLRHKKEVNSITEQEEKFKLLREKMKLVQEFAEIGAEVRMLMSEDDAENITGILRNEIAETMLAQQKNGVSIRALPSSIESNA